MTDAHLRALGRMTAAFQQMELTFSFVVWELISPGDQRRGQCITPHLRGFVALTGVLENLLALHATRDPRLTPEMMESAKAICARARGLEQERNTLVHSTWAPARPGGEPTRLKLANDGRLRTEEVDAGRIDALASDLERLGQNLVTAVLLSFQPT